MTSNNEVGSDYDVCAEESKNIRYVALEMDVDETKLKRKEPFTHGTIMYRRSIYLKSSKYDIRFKYCSDYELYFRILDISLICFIKRPLYKKLAFNDGFSFSLTHRFSQMLHQQTVVYRDENRESFVECLNVRESSIKPHSPYYRYCSARFIVSFIKLKYYRKSFAWFIFMLKSSFRLA